jgi:predicted ATPase
MEKWDKLNKDFDAALGKMTAEDWKRWDAMDEERIKNEDLKQQTMANKKDNSFNWLLIASGCLVVILTIMFDDRPSYTRYSFLFTALKMGAAMFTLYSIKQYFKS